MVNSYIAKKDLDTEMTVVRNEFEMRRERPVRRSSRSASLSTAYLWHNYGKSTIGAQSDIENVPIERLQAFYRTYYQPDNAVLLVAGKFDEAKTLALVDRTFGKIPKPTRTLPDLLHARADAGRRAQRHAPPRRRRPGWSRRPTTCPSGTRSRLPARVDILAQILTDTPSGRLYKALVETKKATSVGGYFMELHDPGFVMFNAEVRQDQNARRREERARQDARRGRRLRADHQGGGRARPRHAPEEHRPDAEQRRPRRPASLRVHRPGRLAPVLPEPRPHPHGDASRTCSRSPRRT